MKRAFDQVVAALKAQGQKRVGEQTWQCPAHDDQHASLSVDRGKKRDVVLHCHAGCAPEAILDALGLSRDLLSARRRRKRPPKVPTNPSAARSARPKVRRRRLKRRPRVEYYYQDLDGNNVYKVVRSAVKTFRHVRINPDGSEDGWRGCMEDVARVLYRLPEVVAAVKTGKTIYVVEGEKDAEALITRGFVATCNSGGAGKWRPEYSEFLRDANVVIVADRDPAGRNHARQVRDSLEAVATSVQVVEALDGNDTDDHLAAGYSVEEFVAAELGSDADADRSTESPDATIATRLISLAEEHVDELFHDPTGDAFVRFTVDNHRETHRIGSRAVYLWLSQMFWGAEQRAVPERAFQEAKLVLEARAIHDGPCHPIFVRVAPLEDGVVVDLCDDAWRAVHITPSGWKVVEDVPVHFRRPRGMLALPLPKSGGDLGQLRDFLNVEGDDDFALAIGWLLAALRPAGPYLVLAVQGEQGSAKSTSCRLLRDLVDPNISPLRAPPRELRDLAIAAENSWLVSLDNLSGLSGRLSDALCRLSTGGGFATRTLYTDSEEAIFAAQRPVLLNGIDALAARGDLLDRAIVLTLPRIREIRPETVFWREFNEARPALLGALFDSVSTALRREQQIAPDDFAAVRMADAARWVSAAEPTLPWPSGRFLKAYLANRGEANATVLEGSTLVAAIRRLLTRSGGAGYWSGTATRLLEKLEDSAGDQVTRRKDWPGNPRALSQALRRLAPNLRGMRIDVEFPRGHIRRITLRQRPIRPVIRRRRPAKRLPKKRPDQHR